jgi:hypothetical protein
MTALRFSKQWCDCKGLLGFFGFDPVTQSEMQNIAVIPLKACDPQGQTSLVIHYIAAKGPSTHHGVASVRSPIPQNRHCGLDQIKEGKNRN